jgi:MerR family Zn(II)-responsive transcriptional regulator of zntA
MTVNELATHAGVTPHAVRYYARIGLLKPARNKRNGYQMFVEADIRRARFISRSQSLGFTLSDIAEIFRKSRQRQTPCPLVRDIIRRRLEENATLLTELVSLRDRMKRAIRKWQQLPDAVPTGDEICHLIESIDP